MYMYSSVFFIYGLSLEGVTDTNTGFMNCSEYCFIHMPVPE